MISLNSKDSIAGYDVVKISEWGLWYFAGKVWSDSTLKKQRERRK